MMMSFYVQSIQYEKHYIITYQIYWMLYNYSSVWHNEPSIATPYASYRCCATTHILILCTRTHKFGKIYSCIAIKQHTTNTVQYKHDPYKVCAQLYVILIV